MKFLHFGDQHWRPLDRHDEYKATFADLFSKAKSENIDAFILCGDLVHEKTQRITPELIDCLGWFFTEMVKIAPVHMILGNHDGNLKNLDRKDAISPIVKMIDNKDINLYLKSGVYPLNDNFNICAFSPFDEKGWGDVYAEKGKVNICLFHGAVQGSMTDLGHKLDGEVDLSFFKDYDFSMLSDIHKFQFMDKEKRIAYPGSTLQQNFGESIRNHGFLLWDIKDAQNFEVEHIEIENKKPFVSLDWNGKIGRLVFDAGKYPEGARYRIVSESKISQHDRKIIEKELKERVKASSVKYKNEKSQGGVIDDSLNKQLRRNLRDPVTVYSLFKEFSKEANLKPYQWDMAKNVLSEYIQELQEQEDVVRGSTWIPRKLEFSNIMQFGENNLIDFDACDGIVGVFAPNMSGKSTTIAAMVYALFGRLDREILQNQYHGMVNNRKSECSASLYFTVSGKNYKVTRITKRVDKKDGRFGANSQVWLYEMTSDWEEEKSLTGIKPQETEKNIRKIVGTLEDFKLTALANQRNVESFIRERVTERKQHLTRFRDLQSLDFLSAKAKKDFKEKKAQLKLLSALDWDNEIHKLEKEKEDIDHKIDRYESKLEILRDSLLQESSLLSSKDENACTQEDVNRQQNILDLLIEREKDLIQEIEDIKNRKQELQSKIDNITEMKSLIDVDKIREKLKKKNELEKEISSLSEKMISASETLKQKQKTVKKLDVVPCGDKFPTCKYIKDAHEEKKNIEPQKKLIKELEESIQRCEILIVDEDDYEEKLQKYRNLEKKEISLLKKISLVSVEAFEEKLKSTRMKIKIEEEKLEKMKANVSQDDSAIKAKNKIETLKKEIKEIDSKRISCASRLGKIDAEIDEMISDKMKYEKINDLSEVYEIMAFAFGKKGIPNQILRTDLPAINEEIKEVLEGIDGVDSVEFELEEGSDKLDIYVEGNGTRIPVELCSGAQLVIASIALRVGLMRASNLPKPEIIVLDEPFENTDSKRAESIINMIESLKKWFKKIFLISHMESLKETADCLIEVSSKGLDSYVYHE